MDNDREYSKKDYVKIMDKISKYLKYLTVLQDNKSKRECAEEKLQEVKEFFTKLSLHMLKNISLAQEESEEVNKIFQLTIKELDEFISKKTNKEE